MLRDRVSCGFKQRKTREPHARRTRPHGHLHLHPGPSSFIIVMFHPFCARVVLCSLLRFLNSSQLLCFIVMSADIMSWCHSGVFSLTPRVQDQLSQPAVAMRSRSLAELSRLRLAGYCCVQSRREVELVMTLLSAVNAVGCDQRFGRRGLQETAGRFTWRRACSAAARERSFELRLLSSLQHDCLLLHQGEVTGS